MVVPKARKVQRKAKRSVMVMVSQISENILSDSLKVEILPKEGHHGGKANQRFWSTKNKLKFFNGAKE